MQVVNSDKTGFPSRKEERWEIFACFPHRFSTTSMAQVVFPYFHLSILIMSTSFLYSLLLLPFPILSVCPAALSILISPSTPVSLSLSLQNPAPQSCAYTLFSLSTATSLPDSFPGLVVDALHETFLSLLTRESLEQEARLLNANDYELDGVERIRTEEDWEAIGAVVKWMQIKRICVFTEAQFDKKNRLLDAFSDLETEIFQISQELDLTTLELLIRKQIKGRGYTSFLLLLSPPTTIRVCQALESNKMGKNQLLFMLSWQSALYRFEKAENLPEFARTGPVFLAEKNCEETGNEGELLICRVQNHIEDNTSRGSLTIMNIVQNEAQNIGYIQNHTISASLPTTSHGEAGPVAFSSIIISFNNGTLNPPGVEAGTTEPADYLGVQLMVAHIQRTREILPFHNLAIRNVSLGIYEFDADWMSAQLQTLTREELGIAMLASEYSGVTMGLYSVLQRLNYVIPLVGAANTSPALTSPVTYPLYTRVAMSDAYMSVLYGRMLDQFGWKNIVVLYCDDPWSEGLYTLLKAETTRRGITIKNQEKYRQVPTSLTGNYSDYIETYQDIVNSKVRIAVVILYGDALTVSLEALYDLGMRQGDMFFLAVEWMSPSFFQQEDSVLAAKLMEICNGALQFFPAVKIGSVGETLSKEYENMFEAEMPFYACFYYDAAYLIASALDFLVVSGGDYESTEVFNKVTRSTRFRGCTGVVTIQEGTNDRYPMMYSILNAQVNSNGTVNIAIVGTYNPSGLVLFNFTSPIIWPDNTTTTPPDTRFSSIDCPFEEKQIVTYVPGMLVAYLSLVAISVVTIFLTGFIWKKWWNLRAEQLTMKAEITFDDYVLLGTIAVEMLQYGAMGPTFPSWAATLQMASDSFSVNLETMIRLKGGMFWNILRVTLAGVAAWMGLLMVVFFKLDVRYKFCFSRLGDLAEKALPILGNMCFLPIISILMSVFQCGQAVQHGTELDYTDAFLKQDCYQQCWTSPHLYYAIASVVGLFLYAPAAIMMRPTWQNMQPYLHVKTSPAYLMIKTMYQVAIIVMSKTLKAVHDLTHTILFLCVTGLFCAVTMKWRPYGYGRPNLWHSISLLSVVWLTLLSLLDILVGEAPPYVWLGLFLFGITSLCVFGVIWQILRLPALLYRSKGIHVMDLFRFMFSRGNKYLYLFNRNRVPDETSRESERRLAAQSGNIPSQIVPTFARPRSTGTVLV